MSTVSGKNCILSTLVGPRADWKRGIEKKKKEKCLGTSLTNLSVTKKKKKLKIIHLIRLLVLRLLIFIRLSVFMNSPCPDRYFGR